VLFSAHGLPEKNIEAGDPYQWQVEKTVDAITKVLDQYAIPLIDDEVITGFGRTGEWFGCAKYGFEPDSMSIAKALSSSYMPISAVLLSPELTDIIDRESRKIGNLAHGLTYGGHPVTAAVALRTLEIYQKRDVVGHVRHVEPVFLKRLASMAEHPLVGEAKGVGRVEVQSRARLV